MRLMNCMIGLVTCLIVMGCTSKKNDAIQLSREATVKIVSPSANRSGTGFLIGEQYVLTCFHVIAVPTRDGSNTGWNVLPDIQVTLSTGETIAGTLAPSANSALTNLRANDFAVVKLASKPLRKIAALTLVSEKEGFEVGDSVVFSGFPLAATAVVTHREMISGFDNSVSLIFVQASINKGNSGGALLNAQGHVIGIISTREGGISPALQDLTAYIDKNAGQANVQVVGVDPLQAIKATIQTLDQNISTGIGYARSIKFARDYLEENRALLQ